MKRATETLRLVEKIIALSDGDKAEAVVMATAVLACVIEKTGTTVPKGWVEESIGDFPGIAATEKQREIEAIVN